MHARNFSSTFSFFHKNQKNISEHENHLKNKFEHLFEAKFGRHQSLKSFWPLEGQWALAVSRGAHLGFGRTLGSAGPLPTASGPSFFQRSLAIEPGLSQRCTAILPLNRGRGVSFELSHSTLIHSHSLKLCSRVFIGFLLKIWIQETSLSLISLLQERRSNSWVRPFNSVSLT